MAQVSPGKNNFTLDQIVMNPLAQHSIGFKDSSFVIAEWGDPGAPEGPPRPIAPLHVHHVDDEAWYILEGSLAFQLGDQKIEVGAGAAVFAPRGMPHTYWNPLQTRARYLLIMTPTIRSLIDELHATTARDPLTMQAIYKRYNSELL